MPLVGLELIRERLAAALGCYVTEGFMTHQQLDSQISRAAQAIERADALLICAGAGMGVDSGLPDFRGPKGFWGGGISHVVKAEFVIRSNGKSGMVLP